MHITKIVFFFLCLNTLAHSQMTINPFELTPRSPKKISTPAQDTATAENPFRLNSKMPATTSTVVTPEEPKRDTSTEQKLLIADTIKVIDTLTQGTNSVIGNPFAIISRGEISKKEQSLITYPVSPKIQKASKEKAKKASLLPIILTNLLIFTLLLTIFRSYITKIYKAVLSDNMFKQLFNERFSVNFSAAFLPLYIFFFANLGLFLYLIATQNGYLSEDSPYTHIGYFTGGLMASFALKHFILLFIGRVFSLKAETAMYNFTIITFSIFTGLLFVLLNLIITYTSPEVSKGFTYLGIDFIIIIYLLKWLRGLFIANKFLVFHKFHFLLYICTLEIAPVLVSYHLVTNQVI